MKDFFSAMVVEPFNGGLFVENNNLLDNPLS